MKKYEVIVKNGRGKTYSCRAELRVMGMGYSGSKSKWIGNFEENEAGSVSAIQLYCKKHGLSCEVNDNKYRRNSSYRSDFFRTCPPAWHDKYFCIYCGRLLPVEQVTVDHIIPVQAARSNTSVQSYISRKGWADENDIRNLGASCRTCNSRKGKKMGIWILRGRVGKSNAFQWARWIFRICILLLLIVVAVWISESF